MPVLAAQSEATLAVRTDLCAIFVSLELSKSTWLKAIDTAIVFGEALEEYADVKNWNMNDDYMLQIWVEPNSDTPEAYHGCELAQKALGVEE